MIVARCTNGIVLFQIQRVKATDALQWLCVNDGSSGAQPRTPLGFEQLLKDMAAKAVALRGALQQVVDLPEIS